jgi:rhomboid family GlyGly-CTERM serine protease
LRLRLTAGGLAWCGLSALLAAGAWVGFALPSPWIDWEAERALDEPWRAITAAWVHWSLLHLVANLLGVAVVAALGVAARLPPRMAWAWAVAWPLTHVGLLVQPALAHYGGLSGVLHAGVAVAATALSAQARGARRAIGAAVLAGLAIKLALEEPWGPPLRLGGGWDIAVAPLAHASGVAAGILCALIAMAMTTSHARSAGD